MVPENFDDTIVFLSKQDEWYMELLEQCKSMEPEFRQIKDKLTEEEQEQLDLYISTCEDMLYRQTQLAAEYYARHGAKAFEQK